ncbi:MAG: PDZ domain-containing protein, partial [Leptolyngbya sp.]|nr:PDZ domain-containing protein [Candidatus Melainabacteria bacterium]
MTKFAKSLSRLLLASLFAVSLSGLGTPAFAQEKTDDLTNNPFLRLLGTPAESAWTADKLERQYDEVWTEISDHYFDRAALSNWLAWRHKFDGKMKTLADLDNALDEMVSSLDNRWTTYVGKQTSSAMSESFENNIALGIWASKVADGNYQVYYLEYGSPAYASSLRKGDRITHINGQKLSDLPTLAVQALFVGKAGEKRELTFTHDGVTETTSLTVVAYPDKEYEIVLRDDHVLYLRLPAFSPTNTATFKEELLAVFEDANVKVEKIVLDLRGNLGGYTTEVKPIASLFIDQGLVYSLRIRDGRETSLETKRIESPLPFEL